MILADLPGPKIRIGKLKSDPLLLNKGDKVILTTKDIPGTAGRIPVNYKRLPESVSPGSLIYLNDGFIQLEVEESLADEVACKVVIGGPLLSHKGLNLPGAKIFMETVTEKDLHFVDFALKEGIDAFSVSFVEKADDILKVRKFARERGKTVHVIAKIERMEAVRNIDEILNEADALMIARGDLGVQIPIEDVPAVQKKLIRKANLLGRPVITATQMLLSMTENIRPTRAEASDVANAILDGTDAVMLSEETSIGKYPAYAVDMMARISLSIEREIREFGLREYYKANEGGQKKTDIEDAISLNVMDAVRALDARYILAPTQNGNMPRRISRFKPNCWILAFSRSKETLRFLDLSYGVFPVMMGNDYVYSTDGVMKFMGNSGLAVKDDIIIIAEDASPGRADHTDLLRIIRGESLPIEYEN